MANNAVLDRAFVACSHPIRRGILERLAGGEMTVGEATGDFGVSKPAISKHLKLLEEAGAITRVIDGRTHRLRLREQPLNDAYAWMTGQRELWERKLDTVEEYLREQRANQRLNAGPATTHRNDARKPHPQVPCAQEPQPQEPHPQEPQPQEPHQPQKNRRPKESR